MIHYMTVCGIGDAWVGNELHTVQSAGIPFAIHAMRRPTRKLFGSPWAQDLNARTRVLYPLPPLGLLLALMAAPFRFGKRFFAALGNVLFGRRESLRNRVASMAHFFVACYWAGQLRREEVTHIHSQWIHSGGTIAMFGSWLLGKTFSFTGHAADLFRERVALEDKIRRADFIICISEFHREFYKKHGARDQQLHIAYCGIELDKFAPAAAPRARDGKLRIVSSGRLVAKKGFNDLIAACRLLADRGIDLTCVIAGSGPLQEQLQGQIDELKLRDRVKLTGQEIKQEEIPGFMHTGDVYCLPCVWAEDGDVDGLPQMLMEAMACGLPVVSTRLVGIPDLVIHEKTGLLVEPRQVQALATAIERLASDSILSLRLSQAALVHLRERFDLTQSLEPLLQQFRRRLNPFASTMVQSASLRNEIVGNSPSGRVSEAR